MIVVDATCKVCKQPMRWLSGTPMQHEVCFDNNAATPQPSEGHTPSYHWRDSCEACYVSSHTVRPQHDTSCCKK